MLPTKMRTNKKNTIIIEMQVGKDGIMFSDIFSEIIFGPQVSINLLKMAAVNGF